ncbi:universal stress protein [Leptodesmis sichuanensis]|uniref:universal stress protein n=1 Tax=Leptodesmis sichuanensis TaxID=2906798 RepID=UPI001F19628F|nr:universal stress protein [Leptodesmis sichuanensis]UIE37234.1 universal stress protein [Leptodesmis sichuanensis A121]
MKILIAVDTTETGHQAFEQALRLLNLQAATVLLLSIEQPVVPPPSSDMPGFFSESPEMSWQNEVEMANLEEERAKAALDWAERVCQQAGVPFVVPRLEIGDPKHVICEVAKQEAVDVIVVGSHHKGMVERILTGSVSDYVVHHAECPVLVVH